MVDANDLCLYVTNDGIKPLQTMMLVSIVNFLIHYSHSILKNVICCLAICIYAAWRMRMKLLHALEQIQMETVLSEEIELDEKYFLNSHKGEQIEGVAGRKRGGKAKKRGLSSEQICLPTVIQRGGNA